MDKEGTSVGSVVGIGASVGFIEGIGTSVGNMVGSGGVCVGSMDGSTEEDFLRCEASSLGNTVDASVGSMDGIVTVVGSMDGTMVAEGAAVGINVRKGAWVGRNVGNGAWVGNIDGKLVLCLCRDASSDTIPGLISCKLGGEINASRHIATKIIATTTKTIPA